MKSTRLKIIFTIITSCFILTQSNNLFAYSNYKTNDKRFEFLFQPLGFLQFGPIAEFGVRIVSNLYFDAHFRYSALSVGYAAIATDLFEDEMNFASAAAGGVLKYLFLKSNTPNCAYVAVLAEYGWGGTYGWAYVGDWEAWSTYYVVMFNGGYRWRYPSGFFLNLGVYIGFQKTITDKWWYKNDSGTKFYDPLETRVIGMLELSVGVEF